MGTANECEDKCEADRRCRYFTHVPDHATGPVVNGLHTDCLMFPSCEYISLYMCDEGAGDFYLAAYHGQRGAYHEDRETRTAGCRATTNRMFWRTSPVRVPRGRPSASGRPPSSLYAQVEPCYGPDSE